MMHFRNPILQDRFCMLILQGLIRNSKPEIRNSPDELPFS